MPKDTKTALMDFAEHAARARGFDGFSYADLAEAIGIRKASIHYHFPTKADLSTALMDRYCTEIQHACANIDATHDTGGERLKALIALYRAALNDGKTLCLCVSFTISRESLSDDVVKKISNFRAMLVSWIKAVFEMGAKDSSITSVRDPLHEARATLALLEGAHLTARADQDATVFDAVTTLLTVRCQ